MAMVLHADRELDCKGLLCPLPVIQVSKQVKTLEIGQVLKMIATDPGSMKDMEAWARQTGNALLDAQKDGKEFVFYIKRQR